MKSIQIHIFNTTDITEKRTGKFIKPSYTLLTSSRNYLDYMSKTIFNNINIEVKSNKKCL